MRRLRAALSPAHAGLLLILAAGLVLRVLHDGYGLPYVYNIDEGSHFTNRAVAMFGGSADPGYFQNPSDFTYLEHLALRLRYGHLWPFGHFHVVIKQFSTNPTAIYETGRALAAVLCLLGVVSVFWVGRRLWGALEGVAAAAVLGFAFLSVAYSRVAVTDTGTLAAVALSLYGSLRVHEQGLRRHYLIAGAFAGLAVGFKYTSGLVLLPLLVAAATQLGRDRRAALTGASLGLGAALAVFALTNPYFFIDFGDARRQIRAQAQTAGSFPKLGQEEYSGPGYYLESLTWGLGWAAAAAALGGAVLEFRRNVARGLVLAAFPLALFAYLSLQSRFFGRWFLPAYPVFALLCGVSIAWLARLVPRGPLARVAALALLLAAVLAQPLAADVRTARLLGREDTRQLARDFLVKRYPPRLRIVIEPAVPGRYYRLAAPGRRAPASRKQFVRSFIKDIRETRIDYGATLRPQTIDQYRRAGFCMVMTMSVIRGRSENARLAPALAYYRRLERESRVLFHASPYDPGARPVKFHFDLSYNYYPTAFARPGPEVAIYKLHHCKQGYGQVPKGTGTPAGSTTGLPPAPGAAE